MVEAADRLQAERQRERIWQLLSGGLATDWQQRAYGDADVQRVIAELKKLAPDDLEGRLRVAGFTPVPYAGEEDPEIEQACRTCMYYELHKKYCALPELDLYAEPEWSCILWRI